MNKPIIGLPDFETFIFLIAALYAEKEVMLNIYTIYQTDIMNQLNIDPSSL
jgi:hypothetical protein